MDIRRRQWAWIWAAVFLLLSCVDDALIREEDKQVPAEVSIGLRSVLNPETPDDRVSGLRIMAFDVRTQSIRSNRYYPASELSPTIKHTINTGTYDFVVITNEPRDGVVNVALDGVHMRTDLEAISLPETAFMETTDIPMLSTIDNVRVLSGNQGVRINGTTYAVWEITVKRLGARFDILVYGQSGAASDLTAVTFSNIPDEVLLMGGSYAGARTTTRTYTRTANPGYFQPATVPGAAWAVQIARIILPSNVFSPVNQPEKAVVFTTQLAGGVLNPQCTLEYDAHGGNYTIPGNTSYKITGKIDYPTEINVVPADWGVVPLNGTIYNKRTLNVSAFTATATDLNMARIYFTSSEANVQVASTGYAGASGSTTFEVNNIFGGLAGASAPNLHYTKGTSEGYIDIIPTAQNPQTATCRIYLEANGLVRELTIHTENRTSVAWNQYPFAGTFHRWNQVGERVVYGEGNYGAWTAEVEYPSGQTSFVALSTQKSLDANLGTDNPGDAESFKVINGTPSVSGSGPVYFRVGLTGTLSTPTSTPRYARVRVTTATAGTRYLYVRQGEAADYVMRPDDTGGSGQTWGSPTPRPKAVKMTNYNLTDPNQTVGKVDRGYQGYTFTSYPSQSGYLFQWFATPGWSPMLTTIPAWNTAGAPGYWSENPTWETCPPGYHRPDDGSTSTPVDPTQPNTVANSEIRQSLWLNPPTGDAVNMNNGVFGYYADGFFERHQITDLIYTDGSSSPNYTSGKGVEVAFAGLVMYNPRTYASIFLPAAPRYNWNGNSYGNIAGTYWTSSAVLQNALNLAVYEYGAYMPQSAVVTYGRNIRCVAN